MDNTVIPSDAVSPTGSTTSSTSNSSRKRERGNEGDDGDEHDLPSKRNNRTTILKPPKPAKITLEAVLSKLNDVSTDIANQRVLLQDLPIIRAVVDSTSTDVATLKATTGELTVTTNTLLERTKALTTTTNDLHNRTNDLAQENAEFKSSVSALEARVNQLCTAENANALQNQRMRTSPRNELAITGLTLGLVSEVALIQITSAIAAALKFNASPDEFTTARLLRKPQATTVHDLPGPPRQEPVPMRTAFAVVCSKPSTMSRFVAAKRSFGSLKYSQLDKGLLTHPDIVAGQPGDPTININELLPSNVLKLLNDAKTQLKPAGFKYVWSRDLTVYAKCTNDSLVQIINSPADITKLLQLYQHQSPNASRQ